MNFPENLQIARSMWVDCHEPLYDMGQATCTKAPSVSQSTFSPGLIHIVKSHFEMQFNKYLLGTNVFFWKFHLSFYLTI